VAWNGHFQSKYLPPLFVFNQFGDLERCAPRPGNVHSADGWEDVLKPVLARYSAETRPSITRRRFRADAAFAIPALFDLLATGKLSPKTGGEAPKPVGSDGLAVLCGRHTASHAARRQKLLGKSLSAAVRSPEASRQGNLGL
jgi:hypothetical protein